MKNDVRITLAALCLSVLLSGCSSPDQGSTSSSPSVSEPVGSSSAPTPLQEAPKLTMRVGNDTVGYVSLPEDWRPFQEEGTDLQYCDPTGRSIVTLNLFDTSGLSEEQLDQVSVESAATSVWKNIEHSGGKDIVGALVKLGNYDANQVYAVFDDGTFLVTWSFETGDGEIHYLAAEGPADMIMTTVEMVQQSYSATR